MAARILVLDAEPVVQEVVTRILSRHGYEVRATGSISKAFQMVKASPPDLLITNVLLPGIRGHDAASLLRELHPGMRVLMVAGLPDDQQIYDMTKSEGIEPFPKPFSAGDLATKVKEMLGR